MMSAREGPVGCHAFRGVVNVFQLLFGVSHHQVPFLRPRVLHDVGLLSMCVRVNDSALCPRRPSGPIQRSRRRLRALPSTGVASCA